MIRIAFTQIGGEGWIGGLNYQINLLQALIANEGNRITPVIFLGKHVEQPILKRFNNIQGLQIVRSAIFDQHTKSRRLWISILCGIDYQALNIFKEHQIDIVFESANYYGWRFPLKSIAWIPDLQHKRLRHYFSFFAYWKREIGFRMQILTNRQIMLSSEDARRDFQYFYHASPNRLHVVRFSVPVKLQAFDVNILLERYQLPDNFFYMPNQFWGHKNHECVIQALAISKQMSYDITVVVSGNTQDSRDPQHFPNLMKLVNNLSVNNNFKVLGLIPYEDVQALMVSAEALINPSRFEGWSTTVEEAKALGVKMLLSDINVHREQAGDAAQYFGLDDSQGLANLLIYHAGCSFSEKFQRAQNAANKAQENMKQFAAVFANMVDKAIAELA